MSRKTNRKTTVSADELAAEIIELGQTKQFDELHDLISTKVDNKLLEKAITRRINRADATILWNFLLVGCESNTETMATKRFGVIMAVLNEINQVEVTSKQCFDLVTRIFIELPKLRVPELIEMCEYCVDSLRIGDAKCTGWKDLFPELMKLIIAIPKITVQNEIKSGAEYCESQIRALLSVRWPESVLSSIGAMFMEMPLSKNDKSLVLNKLCENFMKLDPQELPMLSFQLFSLCSTPTQLMIPLIGLNQYFQQHLYQKLLDESEEREDLDRIERFSNDDLLAAQNTILYHLNSCSEYKIREKEMIQQIRPLVSNPKYILTPFFLSALLTICNVSRYLETVRLSGSSTLPFIRSVIQNNEKETELVKNSAWFRDTLEHNVVDFSKLYSTLIDQSKEDIYTPGLVGMAFVLLKTPQYCSLNIMGITFLENILKARHQLSSGVLQNLQEFLFADQEAPQYGECLTRLSLSQPMLISENVNQIKEMIDFFLQIPGEHAMRMMQFVIPLIKTHSQIRDYFIDMLRRAMYHSNKSTRQMGIYGFCLVLKAFRNHGMMRSISNRMGPTQISISGFSVMSQQTLGSGSNAASAFDMHVLEIIGILRKCFSQKYEIKEILYDGLSNAIQHNHRLIPHVLQFLDWHFRSYFNELGEYLEIDFEKCVSESGEPKVVQLNDHIGKLLHFMAFCLVLLEIHGLDYDSADLKEFFERLLEKIDSVNMEQIGLTSVLTPTLCHTANQFLNCIEGLMYYILKMQDLNANTVAAIKRLFTHHQTGLEQINEAALLTKRSLRKRGDKSDENVSSSQLRNQNITFKAENVWELPSLHCFMEAICRHSTEAEELRKETKLCIYILNVARDKVQCMCSAPDYKQIKYSKSNFKYLAEITAFVMKYFVKDLIDAMGDAEVGTSVAATECLYECLKTATILYQRKFDKEFLKYMLVPAEDPAHNGIHINMISTIQRLLDGIAQSVENNDMDNEHQLIMVKLFQCLELLYDNIDLTQNLEHGNEIHKWLQNFCKHNEIRHDELSIVHKLLFSQRIRTQKTFLFEGIAKQVEKVLGQHEAESIEDAEELKSITEETIDSCIIYLCHAMRKQIEDIEYFISKVKSYCAQMKTGGQTSEGRKQCENRMVTIERRICTQLIFISRVCIRLANTPLSSGECMDIFLKTLTQYYICLANLARHFINRQKISPISYKSTKFDQLVQTIGKQLPLKIYKIITYIEEHIFDKNKAAEDEDAAAPTQAKKKALGLKDKAKVTRETKFIPKLINRIETFNKYVICLSKKSDHDLNKCLHFGTMRDFRIRSEPLRQAIERARKVGALGSDSDEDENAMDEINDEDLDFNSQAVAADVGAESLDGTVEGGHLSGSTISGGSMIKEVEGNASLRTTVMQNAAAINKKVMKRRQLEAGDTEESEVENRRKRKKPIPSAANPAPIATERKRRSNRRNIADE